MPTDDVVMMVRAKAPVGCLRVAVGWLLVCALSATALAATRPRYGGTLRVEIHASIDTADPPQLGPGMPDLAPGFSITRWEAGRRAVYAADERARRTAVRG